MVNFVNETTICTANQQVEERYPLMEYFAQVYMYYIPRERNSWGMKFNVTKTSMLSFR